MASGGTDIVTYHGDAARTGQNLNETLLTPASVNSATFGKTGFLAVDGKVDAQPLYLSNVAIPGQGTRNVLYVATEHDSVYAFDGDTSALLWHVSLLGAGETTSDNRGCGQVTPEIGITSTPVIDRTRGPNGAIYVVAMSKDGAGNYFQRLHALDVTSGVELFGAPRNIQATFPGTGAGSVSGTVIFDPKQYKERSALLLINGTIVTTWASHCDINPYTGWLMSYDASTLAQTSVLNITPNGSEAAMWNAGGGPAADSAGNFFVLLGNGTFDTTLTPGGFPNRGDYGNAFLKVSTSGGLAVADYFNMWDTVSQSNADLDLGSGGAIVLPDLTDAAGGVRRLTVGAGKDMRIYVANRDSMGKWNGSTDQIYQEIIGGLGGSVFSTPAYFNNTVYFGAVGDAIRAFSITNATLSTTATSQTSHAFPYPGSTPGISANGTANGILWAVENTSLAVLHAYEAGNLSHELYNSNQAAGSRDTFGAGNKFITPTIVNGHVYVGTPNGVAVFSLFPLPVPSAPAHPRWITPIVAGQATLAWDPTVDPSVTGNGYRVAYGTASGTYTTTIDVGNQTSRTITGLTAGQQYFFAVFAYNRSGVSAPSQELIGVVPVPCASSLGSASVAFSAGPGTGSAAVTAGSCTWTATTNVPWINITAGATGTGNGAVSYSVAANPSTTARTGMLLIGGGAVTVVQSSAVFSAISQADLVWQNDSTRQATVWYMGGAQGNVLQGWSFLSSNGVPGWRIVGTGDLDGDGRPDLIWQNDATRQVTVWYMGGAQGNVLQSWNWISSAGVPGWRIVAVGDFNGDGHPDLVWQNDATRQVTLWYLGGAQGNVMFSWSFVSLSGVPGWTIVGSSDFDGDGHPDLVWQNDTTRQVTVWFMGGAQGNALLGWNWLSSSGVPGWTVAGARDFNGDGHSDLIWQNDSTRQVTVWYMGGALGTVFQGWNWETSMGFPGWTVMSR